MQPSQFDRVSRLFGARSNRRSALRAGGGLIAAASSLGGIQQARAQETTATPLASPVAEPGADDPTFMFVQSFESGAITPNEDSTDLFTLTLKHSGGQTVYFSDRPERIVGAAPTQRFLDGMSFDADNPPNAALVMSVTEDDHNIVVVELTEPAYDQDADTLTYTATLLDNYQDLGVTFQEVPKTTADLVPSFGGASLFIDDCSDEKIACVRAHGGEEDCVGNIKVGFCFSWSTLTCNACRDYSAQCNSTFEPWCAGDCLAISDEICPNDCSYC